MQVPGRELGGWWIKCVLNTHTHSKEHASTRQGAGWVVDQVCAGGVGATQISICFVQPDEIRARQINLLPGGEAAQVRGADADADQPPRASLLVASCRMSTSTPSCGSSTYRTTEPRMKQFRTDSMWGYLSWSTTRVFSSLMLRYWSTEWSVPRIARSFLSSTVTSFPTSSLK
uniref:Uncharacterized protein n=1 Tax=Zea mays TaxID=4577 RepID=C0PAC3_MAIZE|nr:unknown [Zea mays]